MFLRIQVWLQRIVMIAELKDDPELLVRFLFDFLIFSIGFLMFSIDFLISHFFHWFFIGFNRVSTKTGGIVGVYRGDE